MKQKLHYNLLRKSIIHILITALIGFVLPATAQKKAPAEDKSGVSSKLLSGIDAEVFEFIAQPDSPITKKPIYKLNFPSGAIIGGIVRGAESFIAVGSFQIKEYDRVVVFSLPDAIKKVEKLFH